MGAKEYKSVDQLIEILSSKGMSFSQPTRAKRLLTENNYYCVTAYKNLFYKPGTRLYYDGVDFEHLYAVYSFDKQFKTVILKHLLFIEQKIKTAISHQISQKYGIKEKQYLRKANFDQTSEYLDANLKKIKKQLNTFGKKNTAVSHYKANHGFIPFWVLSKCLTMGVVRDLIYILKPEDLSIIINSVLEKRIEKKPARKAKVMIAFFADVRNMCAHDEMLLNYSHRRLIISPLEEHNLIHCKKDKDGNLKQGLNDLTALIISIKYFVNKTMYNEFIQNISSCINSCYKKIGSVVSKERFLEYIGLPFDYEDLRKL